MDRTESVKSTDEYYSRIGGRPTLSESLTAQMYRCEICKRTFETIGAMVVHVRKFHTPQGEKGGGK